MPTTDRLDLARMAVQCFMDQTYPDLELIILDDGDEALHPFSSYFLDECSLGVRRRRYYRIDKSSIAAKFNQAMELATGELLAFWADDDYHHPQRIQRQVDALLGASEITRYCGIRRVPYLDIRTGKSWIYEAEVPLDGTALLRRSYRDAAGPVPESPTGQLALFLSGASRVTVDDELYIATIHGKNNWIDKPWEHGPWTPTQRNVWPGALLDLMGKRFNA